MERAYFKVNFNSKEIVYIISKEDNSLIFDSLYYLRYNSQKALYALSQLYYSENESLEDNAFRCHVYLDLLMEAVGQLNKRLWGKVKPKSIKTNFGSFARLFGLDKTSMIYIANGARNYITHVDERNTKFIKNNSYFGSFNFIYESLDKNTKNTLLANSEKQGNLLDLTSMHYRIVDSKQEIVDIDLELLKEEMKKVHRESDQILSKNFRKD